MTGLRLLFTVLLVASFLWLVFLGYVCWLNWPVIPLDITGPDEAVYSAHRTAIMMHVGQCLLIGLAPMVLVNLLARFFGSRSQS